VVAVVAGAAAPVVAVGAAAAVVAVVSTAAAVELVVPGAPALANWPPRRKDGGPMWVSLYPATPATSSVTDDTPAMTFTRKEGPRDTAL
jgi:hypothetical protein